MVGNQYLTFHYQKLLLYVFELCIAKVIHYAIMHVHVQLL